MNTANPDLIWKIGNFTYPEIVVNFLKRFEDYFCVFSGSVKQLYSNYEMLHSNRDMRTVVVLPNPFAYHDNFFNIPEHAIIPTGMIVSPGEIMGKNDWLLCYRGEHGWKGTEFSQGMEKFADRYGDDDPFLPVILNSDLRRSSNREQPLMHLHRISIKRLLELSEWERADIKRTIQAKLNAFACH